MEWSNDPTVRGMLTMLDEIQKRFADINDLWNKLDKINFYFRDIEEMKLTDDIYIKMNSVENHSLTLSILRQNS